jgi:hypothetical protein
VSRDAGVDWEAVDVALEVWREDVRSITAGYQQPLLALRSILAPDGILRDLLLTRQLTD